MLESDHPLQFASEDKGPTPVEYVLVGLGGCLTAGVAAVAQQRRSSCARSRPPSSADMDLHGILGADPDVRNGFSGVKVDYEIDADASADGDPGARRAVAEAVRRLRHRDQPDRRHRHRGLMPQRHRSRGRGRSLRARDEPPPCRPLDRPRGPRARRGGELVAHPALGLAAAAHPELDDAACPAGTTRATTRTDTCPLRSVADLVAGYAEASAAPVRHGHHGDRRPARRRGVRGGHRPGPLGRPHRGPGARARPAATSPPWLGACRGWSRSRRCTTATPTSCRRGACWSWAPPPAGCRSPTSYSAPDGRSRSRSASTSGCPRTYRGKDILWWLDAVGILDERWDEVDDLVRARHLPSLQLVGASYTLDLERAPGVGGPSSSAGSRAFARTARSSRGPWRTCARSPT